MGTFTFNGVSTHYNLSFNLCNDIQDPSLRCSPDDKAMAVARSNDRIDGSTVECIKLGGSGSENRTIDHFILDKEENNGLKIHMGGSNEQCDDWRDYDLTVDIVCNINAKDKVLNVNVTESNHCFKVVRFEHSSGCKIG